jgi:hypothetical protein
MTDWYWCPICEGWQTLNVPHDCDPDCGRPHADGSGESQQAEGGSGS